MEHETNNSTDREASTQQPPAENNTPRTSLPNEIYRNSQSGKQTEQNQRSYQSTLKGSEPNSLVDTTLHTESQQLRKLPVVLGFVLVVGILCLILYCWIIPKSEFNNPMSNDRQQKPAPGQPTHLLENAPAIIAVNSASHQKELQEEPLLTTQAYPDGNTLEEPSNYSPTKQVNYQAQAQAQAQMDRQLMQEQLKAQVKATRLAKLQQAKESSSTIFSLTTPQYDRQPESLHHTPGLSPTDNTTTSVIPASSQAPSGPTLRRRINTLESSSYLPNTRTQAVSPYEIKSGTVIPAVMISGINSDLPGQLIAQVIQNVYDSAEGQFLLIPQGAKLIGTYDNGIATGQNRVLIAWNRIIYPDASSLNLGAMPGQDQSGYAGFNDKANHHVWSNVRNALLLSAITAGIQLSQPRSQKGDYSYSSQQMIAGSLGMQLNQLGLSSYQSQGNRSPTLSIRPGYRFNVMVSKDMILPPWRSSANHDALNPFRVQTAQRWQ
jgi:type IV secretory pathway VirB10-like protein